MVHGFQPSYSLLFGADPLGDVAADAFADAARLNSLRASDAVIGACVHMTAYENKHRRDNEGVFLVGDKVYVSYALVSFPPSLAAKFLPKYVSPYTITASDITTSTYTIALPEHLHIHSRIHASHLRQHTPKDDTLFPSRAFTAPPPTYFGADPAENRWEVKRVVEEDIKRGRTKYNSLGWMRRGQRHVD